MTGKRITDWDKAYSNADSIPDAQSYLESWPVKAAAFRKATETEPDVPYGKTERQRLDFFLPSGSPKGLFVFVHGGYWYRFDKSYWSHLAAGPLAMGWLVAMPSYTLTPMARVSQITREIADAVNFSAERVNGPIVLCGHSAGGHLVTRQICQDSGLKHGTLERIARVITVSGVHDLRPIRRLVLNDTIGLSEEEATSESPALQAPTRPFAVDCIAGADELPEFRRQNALLANIWQGLGCEMSCHEIGGTHHFNVVEDLENSDGLICKLANQARD